MGVDGMRPLLPWGQSKRHAQDIRQEHRSEHRSVAFIQVSAHAITNGRKAGQMAAAQGLSKEVNASCQ